MRKFTLPLALSAAALALGAGTVAYADQADGRGVKADTDADGVITRAEHNAHAAAMFTRMDANKDGVINAADREARKAERFAALDADGNGEVTKAEFEAMHAKRAEKRAERREDRGEKRFARLDTDNSGGVSAAEMDAAREARQDRRGDRNELRKQRGERGERGEMRGQRGKRGGHAMRDGGMKMLMQADANGDKTVTKAEFLAAADSRFARMDTDKNGSVSAEERKAAHTAMREAWKAKRQAAPAN